MKTITIYLFIAIVLTMISCEKEVEVKPIDRSKIKKCMGCKPRVELETSYQQTINK